MNSLTITIRFERGEGQEPAGATFTSYNQQWTTAGPLFPGDLLLLSAIARAIKDANRYHGRSEPVTPGAGS